MTESASNTTLKFATQLQTDELNRRIDQLWIGIWIATIVLLLSTFYFRRQTGNPTTALALVIQIALNGLAAGNLLLLKTKYARFGQGIFVFVIHLAIPAVLIRFGGTRGFGDIALFMTILVSMLYGWQKWMFLTYGAMGITLFWVLYRDSIGQPIAPLLDYSAQFTSLKFIVTTLVMVFVIRYIQTFYNSLLFTYQEFAEEQLRLNTELTARETTLKQLNDNLKVSRQKIVTAREEERRRLRRDLHDGLGPTLAAQIFRIGIAQKTLEKSPEKTAALLKDVESGIHATLTDVRALVYGLRPPLLDQLGLLGAINDVAGKQREQPEIELVLPSEFPMVSAAVEVALFRIFQTSLDNVIKHAQATRCKIHLCTKNQSLALSVIDNGIGIRPDQQLGVGLTAMKERAEELSGTFDILDNLPRGTHIQVTIPLLEQLESAQG